MSRTGAVNAKVHATKSHRNYSLWMHEKHTKGPKTHVLLHFRNVWCIWDHFVTALNSMQTGQSDAINAKDRATNSHRIFSLRTHLIHTMGHKTHVLLHFVLFECIWDRFVTALNSVQNEPNWGNEWKVCATKSRWNFPYERTRFTPRDRKLMFCCIS